MASEWYYTLNGQQQPAPATAGQLKQLAASGQLLPTDLVWQEGMANWAPASSLKGLFTAPADKPPPPSGEKATPDTRERRPARSKPKAAETQEAQALPPREGGLHPLLVLLLTGCTGGLFGLFYAWSVARAFARRDSRPSDAAGRPLGAVRHPVGVMLLGYLTLGLYFFYWLSVVMRECAAYTGRKDVNARTELSLMFAFPPYGLYVALVRVPELIRAAQTATSVESKALDYAPWFFNPLLWLNLPVLAGLYQEALNRVWTAREAAPEAKHAP